MIPVTKEEVRVLNEMAFIHQQQLIGTLIAAHVQRQQYTIADLIAALRPFAQVVAASEHVDCRGMLDQDDWDQAADCIATYDKQTPKEC